MSETKSIAVATCNDAFIAFRRLATGGVGMDAGWFLLRLFGAKVTGQSCLSVNSANLSDCASLGCSATH